MALLLWILRRSVAETRLSKAAQCAEVFVAMSVLFGVYVFWSDLKAREQQFTFEYAQSYYTGEVRTARMSLREAVADAEVFAGSGLANDEVALILATQIEMGDGAFKAGDAVTLSDYFNGAERCVAAGLCAEDVFAELHGEEARYILCFLGPVYQEVALEGGYDGIVRGLRAIAGMERVC